MTQTETALQKLIDHPLRMPEFLAPARDILVETVEAISESLTEYLRTPVSSTEIEVHRARATLPNIEGCAYYDTLAVGGVPSLRITLADADLATLATALFQGEVDEPSLKNTVAEAVVKRLAEAVSMRALSLGGDSTVTSAGEEALSDQPVLVARYELSVGEDKKIAPAFEITRALSDVMSAPCTTITPHTLNSLDFLATAYLGEQTIEVSAMKALQPGDKIELTGARLDDIRLEVETPNGALNLARAELGSDEGRRCLRVADPANIETNPAPAFEAPVATASAGTGDMPFDAAPLEDGFAPAPMDAAAGEGSADDSMTEMATPMDDMPDFATMG